MGPTSGTADSAGDYLSSFSGKMASLDGQDPTYSACVSDQKYAGEIPDAGNGTTGSWSGPGLVAGFKGLRDKPGELRRCGWLLLDDGHRLAGLVTALE
jgi:hypothetical protein